MANRLNLKSGVILVALSGFLIAIGFVVFDVLFSRPELMYGIVVDKIYVPEKNSTSPHVLPYGKYKSYDYTISTEKHEQWIAFVKVENQILKVNCHSHHYQSKQIGDTLYFKEYTGDLLGIDYFSHNEEDLEKEGID
ncbi:MAG: hypothetical protein JNL53_13090 [Cyclobacteriaceae bacterium]|nr:hypothetical protein [Cyclobacteriaceae bacterium]